MTPPPERPDLVQRRQKILERLANLGDLRPGTLAPRFRKCGKPSCRCATEGDPGHGPVWLLSWTLGGKTQTRAIPEEAVEETQAQIAEYERARALTRELFAVGAEMCDQRLKVVKDARAAKKTSRRHSRRTSSARSSPRSRT